MVKAMSEEEENGIEKLPGVGPATADKLKEAGYSTLLSIAVESPKNMADLADIGETVAAKAIAAAKKVADVGGFETGDVVMKRREDIGKLTTCSKALNSLKSIGCSSKKFSNLRAARLT